ncbi:MAG: TIGR00375 family protein [Candidatus Methanofastidiosia archaeon]
MINVDFHIHSRYSGGTSDKMSIEVIAKQAKLKGLDVVGSGDCLHPLWRKHLKETLSDDLTYDGCRFILTCEVEDSRRVHHLILFPSFSAVDFLYENLKKHSPNITKDGRCTLRLNGAEIVEFAKEASCEVGPCHAFTPWTAIYKEFDSLKDCYQDQTRRIHFLELGLSADTELADQISELKNLTFMSNSDAHSPWPHRLGREFNRLKIKEVSYSEIVAAIRRKKGRRFTLNVGLDPKLGKYHRSACIKCYEKYSLKDAISMRWRCECGGRIKKGVFDRISELSDRKNVHPQHRPPYIKTAPLSEIISLTTGYKDIYSKKVQSMWKALVERFSSEIAVLLDASYAELSEVSTQEIAKSIVSYREGKMRIEEGGGGRYGKVILEKALEREVVPKQRSLDAYF